MSEGISAAARLNGDFAPAMVDHTDSVLSRDVWTRTGLSPIDRCTTAVARSEGRVHTAERTFELIFDAAAPELTDNIDATYRVTYCSSPYLPTMVSARSREASVRIRLRKD